MFLFLKRLIASHRKLLLLSVFSINRAHTYDLWYFALRYVRFNLRVDHQGAPELIGDSVKIIQILSI